MENLPNTRKTAGICLYDHTSQTKAIDVRRELVKVPEVMDKLSRVDQFVLTASTKQQIGEMDPQTLVAKTRQMFTFIAKDVGYIIPHDATEWAYTQMRLVDILTRYFADLTLVDVKLAFEMTTTGELDEYFPRDSQGNVDKKHYQQFNAEYLSKILKAYRKKQRDVFSVAYKALPERQTEFPAEYREYQNNRIATRNRNIYVTYKYHGVLKLNNLDARFLYEWLLRIGFADGVRETLDDRKHAMAEYMRNVADGLVNRYTAHNVQKTGINSPELNYLSYESAREKEICRAFDRMINDEINIDKFYKL